MRSIWKGSISFGLVNIPIKIFGATESHSVSFRQVHMADGGRIRYRKVCELEDEEVPNEEIIKAYEAPDGTTVPLTDEDLAALPLPTAKTIEILAFVPADSIDPLQLERSYYIGADGAAAAKPYVLLREALNTTRKVAVAKLALRGRQTLGMLRVIEDALALHTMLWPDEIRPPVGVVPEKKVKVREAELDLADTLMETLGELDVEELHDEYREAVEALVEAKLEGAEPEPAGEPSEGGRVIDLMAALEKSVRAAQQERGEGAGEGGEVKQLRGGARQTGRGGTKKTAAGERTSSGGARKAAASGGKKAASSAKGGGAKKSASAEAGTAGTAGTRKSAAKTTGGKATGGKATGAEKSTAKKSTATKSAAKKSTQKKTAEKKAAEKKTAGKTTAGKTAARKRASA
ncbi:non-homologous end joining protein Ku [Streptomyces sp. 8N706]|uniref:non-homologous end joining protein Ku n=1 Tax=Streptomyces sp. 8N706 TaxID=3457416 RepID=UPI003FD4C509